MRLGNLVSALEEICFWIINQVSSSVLFWQQQEANTCHCRHCTHSTSWQRQTVTSSTHKRHRNKSDAERFGQQTAMMKKKIVSSSTHVTRCSLQLTHFKLFSKHLSGKKERSCVCVCCFVQSEPFIKNNPWYFPIQRRNKRTDERQALTNESVCLTL